MIQTLNHDTFLIKSLLKNAIEELDNGTFNESTISNIVRNLSPQHNFSSIETIARLINASGEKPADGAADKARNPLMQALMIYPGKDWSLEELKQECLCTAQQITYFARELRKNLEILGLSSGFYDNGTCFQIDKPTCRLLKTTYAQNIRPTDISVISLLVRPKLNIRTKGSSLTLASLLAHPGQWMDKEKLSQFANSSEKSIVVYISKLNGDLYYYFYKKVIESNPRHGYRISIGNAERILSFVNNVAEAQG